MEAGLHYIPLNFLVYSLICRVGLLNNTAAWLRSAGLAG